MHTCRKEERNVHNSATMPEQTTCETHPPPRQQVLSDTFQRDFAVRLFCSTDVSTKRGWINVELLYIRHGWLICEKAFPFFLIFHILLHLFQI